MDGRLEMWREIASTLDRIAKLAYMEGWALIGASVSLTARDIRFRIECEEIRSTAHGN